MGIKYLWDTNIVIYFLQQQFPSGAEKFVDELLKEGMPIISAITEIELLCWKTASPKDIDLLHSFINDALVIEIERPIKLKTAELRKQYNIKLPDAIIADTAFYYGFTLITNNIKDFKNITGLEVINPFIL